MTDEDVRLLSELNRANAEWCDHGYGDDLFTVVSQVWRDGLTMDDRCAILTEHVQGLSVEDARRILSNDTALSD